LASPVNKLTAGIGGIYLPTVKFKQLPITDLPGSKSNLHRFQVADSAGGNFLVAGVAVPPPV